ncbi:MAG: hypothetical protein ACYTGB_04800 [Planctomycetota bacterium]|jgi:hypothetical protein
MKALYWERPDADRIRHWDQLDPRGLERVLVVLVSSATGWRKREPNPVEPRRRWAHPCSAAPKGSI